MILIIQWHMKLGMLLNSMKQEACILLKNTDHVLGILGMWHVRNGVHAGILELLWERAVWKTYKSLPWSNVVFNPFW
jgi:hypothetical protein